MTLPSHLLITQIIKSRGGPDRFSKRHDISLGHINAVMAGRCKPGPKTLKALGLA